jgi:hypothetical protein
MHNLFHTGRLLAHITSKGVVGDPTSRLASRALLHHLVNLFERETLGLGHEEVGKGNADGAPQEEDLGSEVCLILANEVGSDDSDDARGELAYRILTRK